MRRSVLVASAVVFGLLAGASAQDSTERLVEVTSIGKSRSGRALQLLRLGHPEPDSLGRTPDQRPALLVVAGLDGRHEIGPRVARSLVDRLVTKHADLLRERTVYIIPDLNPDNAAFFAREGTPKSDFGRTVVEYDADRDGRVNEDPANDLNGDGLITMMRIKHPAPATGLRADLVADPDDPRIMRKPEAAKGEAPTHAVLIEGRDADGDGRFNEDGAHGSAGGGVDLNMNFPALWPEHTDGAGLYSLSEPESLALVRWMLTRDNIVCVLVFGPHDNLLNIPEAGRNAPDGREPLGIESDDKPYYEEVARIFKDTTGMTGAPKGPDTAGSFHQWAYAHFGVYAFTTPVWVRPDLVKPKETDKPADAKDEAEKPAVDDAPEESPADAIRREFQAAGAPQFVIDFMIATPAERAEMMASAQDRPPEEQRERMMAIMALPEELRAKVMAVAQGQEVQPAAPTRTGGRQPGARPGQGSPSASGASSRARDSDDAKWLKYSDEQRNREGFIDWQPFDHPQLGPVEIGGFVPGFRVNPPESEWTRLADEQTAFAAALLGKLPDLTIEVHSVERLSTGLWRITVRGTNAGYFPTASAIARKARRLPPVVLDLRVERDAVVSGQRVARWENLDGSGGFAYAEWTVTVPDGSVITLDVRSAALGDRTLTIHLTEDQR
ncbi:MAG: hypothetical protein AMXMBFR77_18170 [Phycisphaerales bacterium]|nr:M14 family metallopeptidase [Phycisphaerales bacterium]GIK19557.1 MAG: hypothetical protein BroJett004_17210 [Planctomycetota bacterium]